MIPETVRQILRDPVTLEPIPDIQAVGNGFLSLRSGGLSIKNEQELEHFRRTFKPLPPEAKLYATQIKSVPRPETTPQTIVLDIGSGPYDCLSAMPGTHIFLDDLMNLYVDELHATFVGTMISARTELMPFADNSIDVIYSINMIDHVDDMPATLAEMHRVLSPGGTVHCQTYWNSHPLLPTEPGVFDRHFLDEYVKPLFTVKHAQTHAVGDPEISLSYTMDIAGFVFGKRIDAHPQTKPRDRYENPSFLGPQSHVSSAIHAMNDGQFDAAGAHIAALSDEPNYSLQRTLLSARLAIHRDEPGKANQHLKKARSHERSMRNPFARIAIAEIENRRLRQAIASAKRRAEKLAAQPVSGSPDVIQQASLADRGMVTARRFKRAARAFRTSLLEAD